MAHSPSSTRETGPPSIDFDRLPMRVGLGSFMHPDPDRLQFIKQLGVDDILLNMYRTPLIDTDYSELPLSGNQQWTLDEILALRGRVEDAGLRLNAIENLPLCFYDKILLGLPGREEQIEHVQQTLANLARAGIPMLGYYWDAGGVYRSSTSYRLRGGAESMSIDLADFQNAPLLAGREYSEQEMWEYYHYFLEQVLPVAESEGIKLALHPNDPPIPTIGGVPRLFRSREAFDRAFELVPSSTHGCQFCLGNWAAMGEDIPEVIDHYARANKLFYVHFQTISNALPAPLHEVFVDEPGYYDTFEILKKLRDVGFQGLIIPGHVPSMSGDGKWQERSRAFTVGYLNGILRSVQQN